MDILFLNSNVSRSARAGADLTPAPAGLISLAGGLRRQGHRVKIRQLHNHILPQDEESLPLVRAELEALLKEFTPDLLGISCRNVGAARKPANPFRLVQYYSVFYDERIVRAFRMLSHAPVVMGGTGFSAEPALYLKYARPDYGIVGEADRPLPMLVRKLASGEKPAGIPGFVESPDGVQAALAGRDQMPDLSEMGIGACDLVDDFPAQYYEGGGLAPIQTKRGCAMNCIYCNQPYFEGRHYRYRPMPQVIEEMRAYRAAWGVRHFFIVDTTFNHPPDHALEICESLRGANLGVEWFAEVSPVVMTDGLCRAMAASGCIGVTLTPDSCSDAVLRAYRKGFTTAEVRNAISLLHKHGIPFDLSVILGGPGETPETFEETIAFCSEHAADDVVRFYDGMIITTTCPAFRIAVAEGLIDPSKPYEELVLQNDFRAVKNYEYHFPYVKQGRKEFLEHVAQSCRRKRWTLMSKDCVPDPATGEFILCPDISVGKGDRPWWRNLVRNVK